MAYRAQITRANPGCILFLVDQSSSMGDPFGVGQSGESKADAVATILNRFLRDLVLRCTKDEPEPRDYFHIGVIGYGGQVGPALAGPLAGRELLPISEIARSPVDVVERNVMQYDGAGSTIEVPTRFPIWVTPTAVDGTPMAGAFDLAHRILSQWVHSHATSFPPIVINVTDGEANDADPGPGAARVASLSGSDGEALVFNCHISSMHGTAIEFPADGSMLPDQWAQMLFQMSSVLPAPMLLEARQELQRELPEGTRGFTFQADVVAVARFITIGTQVSHELR